jgi:ferrous iron transport protein A
MTLSDLKVGDKVKIVGFSKGSSTYRRKLLTIGLTPGTEIVLKSIAPLGDPIEIEVRGFSVVLRKNEANIIQVEKL